jgi:tRNA-2-methylthio-N6-dimethylallyladenosine synthase
LTKKIFIKTFGCQMNEYDSNRILDLVKSIGYVATTNSLDADCYILNTCHIREKATDKVYHDIGRLKKEFRNKKKPMLLVTGCVAQAESQVMLNREKYIDGVVGPQSYHQIPNIIKKIENDKSKINSTDFEVIEKFDNLNLVKNSSSKISAFLTIQEGCDKFCHFCVVPYTRGPEYSRSFDEIIEEARQLIRNGAKEITLLGQNVNAYEYKNHNKKYRLSHLLFELNSLKELKRIRYTTSHPNDVTKDLIKAHKDCEKLMPILHLPVQSGSSKILKAMNRKHSANEYNKIITSLKQAKPNIRFSSDFIIGYPGETERDFQETLELIEKTKFINSYSFIFSARPGTPASELNITEKQVAKKRLIKLQDVLEKINTQSKKEFLYKSTEVLFENKMKNQNKYFGRDRFLNSVVVESKENLTGKLLSVKINNYNHNSLFGKIVPDQNKDCIN